MIWVLVHLEVVLLSLHPVVVVATPEVQQLLQKHQKKKLKKKNLMKNLMMIWVLVYLINGTTLRIHSSNVFINEFYNYIKITVGHLHFLKIICIIYFSYGETSSN